MEYRKSRRNEKVTNGARAERIKQVMHGRKTQAERTRKIAGQGNTGKEPDIVITAPGRSPVVIEAEYMLTHDVEEDARKRFQTPHPKDQIHPIEAVIDLIYPHELH